MTYQLNHNGRTYYVETERHNYRVRLYAIEVVHSGAEPGVPCKWIRHGYIGSYMPGSHTCGYLDRQERQFSAPARGPKTAARLCLAWFVDNVLVAA